MSDASKLALDTDTFRIIRARVDRVVRRAALGTRVVMVIGEVALPVVEPAGRRVNQSCPVKLFDPLGDSDLRVRLREQLAPALIVDDLVWFVSLISRMSPIPKPDLGSHLPR